MNRNIIRVGHRGRCELDDDHVACHHVVALFEVERAVMCVIFGGNAVGVERVVLAELL